MSFYWKYSRNGYRSKTYKSFIIDVLPSSWSIVNNRYIWHTSFEELEAFLILLQDIEVINNPSMGATKPAYAQFVLQLGYTPTLNYSISGNGFICGRAVIGRHSGSQLPWGFVSNTTSPMNVDVTGLKYDYVIPANPIRSDDLLSHYRLHQSFQNVGNYWDYMPMHSVLINVITAMRSYDMQRTDLFVRTVLGWV
jgi:hypothetical protein